MWHFTTRWRCGETEQSKLKQSSGLVLVGWLTWSNDWREETYHGTDRMVVTLISRAHVNSLSKTDKFDYRLSIIQFIFIYSCQPCKCEVGVTTDWRLTGDMFHNKSRIWKLRPNMLHFPGELLAKVGFIRLAKLAATNNMIKLRNVPLKLNINLVYVNSITVQPWYKPYKIGLMRIASAPNLMQVDGKQLNNKICLRFYILCLCSI